MAALLQKIDKSPKLRGFALESASFKVADPRELILKSIDRLDRLTARTRGLDRSPSWPHVDLVAIKIVEMAEKGREVTREEAELLVKQETAEFKRRARLTGQDLTALELY